MMDPNDKSRAALVVKGERLQAPNSAGIDPPVTPALAGACDCHHHIFDPRFPAADGKPHAIVATVDDYLLFRRRLGLSRSVVIAASTDGDDNRCVLDALDRLGGTSRAVAIARPGISDAALDELHERGVRGLRLYFGKCDIPTPEQLEVFGQCAAKRNWHLQIVASREGNQVS
ncbi:MAG: amidohydrolase family protein, partial [Pseudomonadota bacterium]